MKKASEIIMRIEAQRAAQRQAISRHLDNLRAGKYGRPLSRETLDAMDEVDELDGLLDDRERGA